MKLSFILNKIMLSVLQLLMLKEQMSMQELSNG